MGSGLLPQKTPYIFWIQDYLMVRKGYTKNIEDMEIEEYEFIMELMMELNAQKKDKGMFEGGI